MSTYVPPEFEYEMPPSPEPVVVSRSEAYLTTPSPSYNTDDNNILRFELTGTQMLDLSSIRMYADLLYQKKTGTTWGALDAKDEVVSNMALFQSIELSTLSGTIIERVDDANLLAVIMSHLCFGERWAETTGSYSNSQKSLKDHRKPGTGIRLEINAHKLLGFFHTGKFVMPSILGGGLRITFTLATARKLIVLATANPADVKLTLSNVKIHYDLCIMSQRYQEWFNRQYATKGFRIIWDSYQGHTTHTFTPSPSGAVPSLQQFPLQITAKRCKALVMALRTKPTPSDIREYSGALLSEGFAQGSYQLDVAGVRYPPTAIDSYPRAHEEAIKVCYSNNDVQTENIDYDKFTTDFGKAAATTAVAGGFDSDDKGRFLMCLDFEKYNSSGESGIVIAPNAARLSIAFNNKANVSDTAELSAYLVRSQSLTVVGGQVVVDY